MTANEPDTDISWVDPDDPPELDDDFFLRADQYDGPRFVKPGLGFDGQPKVKLEEVFVSRPVAEALAGIPCWQTLIETYLRAWTDGRLRIAPLEEPEGAGKQPEAAE